jgi:hypothetical protein
VLVGARERRGGAHGAYSSKKATPLLAHKLKWQISDARRKNNVTGTDSTSQFAAIRRIKALVTRAPAARAAAPAERPP